MTWGQPIQRLIARGEEVQRLSRELDEGKVTAVSWDQVAVDVRARLRKLRA